MNPLAVECPRCKAKRGEWCFDQIGTSPHQQVVKRTAHEGRIRLARDGAEARWAAFRKAKQA